MKNAKPWPKGRKKPRFGWKMFKNTKAGNPGESWFSNEEPQEYVPGKWHEACNRPNGKLSINYPFGFHVFFERKAAEIYKSADFRMGLVARRVEVGGAQHFGITYEAGENLKTFTCEKIRILKVQPK